MSNHREGRSSHRNDTCMRKSGCAEKGVRAAQESNLMQSDLDLTACYMVHAQDRHWMRGAGTCHGLAPNHGLDALQLLSFNCPVSGMLLPPLPLLHQSPSACPQRVATCSQTDNTAAFTKLVLLCRLLPAAKADHSCSNQLPLPCKTLVEPWGWRARVECNLPLC